MSSLSRWKSAPKSNDAYAWTGHYNVNRPYTSNGLNQHLTAGPASFTYDARGNLTSDGTNSFTYTSENLLKTGPNATTLTYDPAMRLDQIAGTTTTRFTYDGLNAIQEYDGSNIVLRRFAFDPDGQPIVWYEGSGTTSRRFLSADERGSIVSVTDASGALVGINRYDEYGIPQSSNIGRFQYTGQMWLSEVGLQYSRARIYSPTLGRFLQTDPIGYSDGMNWYAYVHNDPVNFVDPLGLDCTTGPGPDAGCSISNSNILVIHFCTNCGVGGFGDGGGGGSGGGGSSGPALTALSEFVKNMLYPSRNLIETVTWATPAWVKDSTPQTKSSLARQLQQCAADVRNGSRSLQPVDARIAVQAGLSSIPRGMVFGAAAGAAIGSLAGGVGALPGAAAGAGRGGVNGFGSGMALSFAKQACGIK